MLTRSATDPVAVRDPELTRLLAPGTPSARPRLAPARGAMRPSARAQAAKDCVDRAAAALLLLVLLPLLLAAVAVRCSSPGPVLYRQRRIGLDGRPFDMLKFRSMACVEPAARFEPPPLLAPGGVEGVDRRTRVGGLLRRTSLDELPQLLNVLRGDMSLIGPRPERPEYVALFADRVPGYLDRHRVRGGITGLAQVRGLRGQTSLTLRVAADNEYIDGWSPWLDLRILVLTARAVARPVEGRVPAGELVER